MLVACRSNIMNSIPGLMVFSEEKPTSEFSEGMLWMDDRGISVSVLVSHVDSVSLVQLSRYRGSRASDLLPPQPMALPRAAHAFTPTRQSWTLSPSKHPKNNESHIRTYSTARTARNNECSSHTICVENLNSLERSGPLLCIFTSPLHHLHSV